MAHIVINLPEKYYNIIENLEGKLDDDIDMLTIKIIWDKLLPKNYRMNVWSNQNKKKWSEKNSICTYNQGNLLQLW